MLHGHFRSKKGVVREENYRFKAAGMGANPANDSRGLPRGIILKHGPCEGGKPRSDGSVLGCRGLQEFHRPEPGHLGLSSMWKLRELREVVEPLKGMVARSVKQIRL